MPRRGARLLAVALSVAAVGLAGTPAVALTPTQVRINEVESSGGSPGDWIELANPGTATVDLTGWYVKDNDASHTYPIAAGTSIAAGGFLALDVESAFGLGAPDSARLFQPDGVLVDVYSWTSHASTTYGRCPTASDGLVTTGAPTKGTANDCPWPGGSAVAVADDTDTFGTDLSGLSFGSPTVLWAVDNGDSTLYRLVPNGTKWRPDTGGGWASGKTMRYRNGDAGPDTEGVVTTPDGLFVASERKGSGSSLPQILRYDVSSSATTLNATGEWTLPLSGLPANGGPEAVSWIPDSFLTAHGFRDERTGATYDPASYANHGSGLFFAGIETGGAIYGYALNLTGGTITKVATITSGFSGVMDLDFESATGHLWAACDNTCHGRTSILDINGQGRFVPAAVYERPSGMPDYNNEGFAVSPSCASGTKPVLWADDSDDAGHALRSGTLPC